MSSDDLESLGNWPEGAILKGGYYEKKKETYISNLL